MKIETVKLEGFRCYQTEEVRLSNYSLFVGQNNSGKSTVLQSLNKFFESSPSSFKIDKSDFAIDDQGVQCDSLAIEVRFVELPPQAIETFDHYTATPNLTIRLEANRNEDDVECAFFGIRDGFEEFRRFFELYENGPAADVTAEFNRLRTIYPDIEQATNEENRKKAVRRYEVERPEQCDPILSGTKFFGSKGPIASLRKHLEWVFVPAVKDAIEEGAEKKNTLARVIAFITDDETRFDERTREIADEAARQLSDLVDETRQSLDQLNAVLNGHFSPMTSGSESVALDWDRNEKAITIPKPTAIANIVSGSHSDRVDLFGHGLQRNYIIALLRTLAQLVSEQDEQRRSLVLAFEEPELYQHPPQAKLIASHLQSLAMSQQVLLTSHSPSFVRPEIFDNIIAVRKNQGIAELTYVTRSDLNDIVMSIYGADYPATPESAQAKLESVLSITTAEIFFCKYVVLVEGITDIAYISASSIAYGFTEDLRNNGVHIVPVFGKDNLAPFIALCELLGTPYHVVMDLDGEACEDTGNYVSNDENGCNRTICSHFSETYPLVTMTDIYGSNYTLWASKIDKVVEADLDGFHDECVSIKRRDRVHSNSLKNSYLIKSAIVSRDIAGFRSPSLIGLLQRIVTDSTI